MLVAFVFAAACTDDGVLRTEVDPGPTTEASSIDETTAESAEADVAVPTTTPDAGDDPTDDTALPTTLPESQRLPAGAGADGVGDPYYPQLGNGGYDVQRYDIAMVVDVDTDVVDAEVTIDAVALQPLTAFNLDFEGFEVESVLVDGAAAAVTRSGPEMTIVPPVTIDQGADFTAVVSYTGVPVRIASEAWGNGVGWIDAGDYSYVVSEPSGAHGFMPSNDHPSDKAFFRFEITVPDGVEVIANGVNTSTTSGPDGVTWVYELRDPMATYLATIGIGDYVLEQRVRDDGLLLRDAYRPSMADRARPFVDLHSEMIDAFTPLFGPYPFEAYGALVVDDDFGGALETQTISAFSPAIFSNPVLAETVVVHELAHQWFGDALTPATWNDIWLNEGFATYTEWLWRELSEPGFDIDRHTADLAQRGGFAWGPPGDPGAARIFAPTVYQRGGLTLHAVRQTVGDEPFFDGLRLYVERHLHGVVSTADFAQAMLDATGVDIGPLLDDWLFSEPIPDLPGRA